LIAIPDEKVKMEVVYEAHVTNFTIIGEQIDSPDVFNLDGNNCKKNLAVYNAF